MAVGIAGVLNQLTEKALENFASRLSNGRNLTVLRTKRTKLVSAIQAVSVASANYGNIQEMLNKKQNLSAALQLMKREQYEGITLLEAVKNLHKVEAETVNYMTKDESSVDTYKIMLDSPELGLETYAYFTLSEKEVDAALGIDPKSGDLILQRSQVISTILEKNKKAQEIDPEEFEKFVVIMIKTMWQQLQDLARIVSGPHKAHDWKRYIELRAIFSLDGRLVTNNSRQAVQQMSLDDPRLSDRLVTMYNYYMRGGTLISTVSYADIGKGDSESGRNTYNAAVSGNRGHIFEAYLRKQQFGLSYAEALGGSFGSKPWWAGGDVGSTQVKSMVGNVQQVRVASMNNMLQLANQLLEILNRAVDSEKRKAALEKTLTKKIQQKSNSRGQTYMEKTIQKIAEDQIKSILV